MTNRIDKVIMTLETIIQSQWIIQIHIILTIPNKIILFEVASLET
jgi:hypothetical protein